MSNGVYGCLSFFSGALGLDLGLESAGIHHLAVNEIDKIACQTIRTNRPTWKLYAQDIRELSVEQLLSDHNLKPGDLFLMCGGPPCQAFSTAGKRLGLNDERGNVFLHFLDIIGGMLPKYVIIENVRGLLSAALQHRPLHLRGKEHPPLTQEELPGGALKHIISRLEAYGYGVSFNLYNTANYGVPQVRERVVLLCARGGRTIPDIYPTHDEKGRFELEQWRTFADAVKGLPAQQECAKYAERRLQYLRLLKPGQNWRHLPTEMIPEAMGKAYFAQGGKAGFFRRLAWDKPAPTVVTCPTMPATDLAHPCEERPLSVQEYARIQTFPDSWRFEGKTADKYRQIGNAVPVVFGQKIGEHLLAYEVGKEILPPSPIALSRYRRTGRSAWESVLAEAAVEAQLALPL